MPLPPGRYVLKLGVTWQAGGTGHSGTADAPYEVTSSNKIALTKCDVTPARPFAGRSASVTWEVRSTTTTALGPFNVVVVADHAPVETFSVASLAPGASTWHSVSWTPANALPAALSCEADVENALGEAPAFRGDNAIRNRVDVVPPGVPLPIVVLGKQSLAKTKWDQDYTVCNIDPDAFYEIRVTGCLGCSAGFLDGVPSQGPQANVSVAGTTARPACPAGLRWPAALTVGPAGARGTGGR